MANCNVTLLIAIIFTSFTQITCMEKEKLSPRVQFQLLLNNQHANIKTDINKVRNLIANGWDINSKELGYEAAIIAACRYNNALLVELLLAEGADIQVKDVWGKTLIMIAAEEGHENVLECLLDHGVLDINEQTVPMGYTALHLAVCSRYVGCHGTETIEQLLDRGADKLIISSTGKTALDYANILWGKTKDKVYHHIKEFLEGVLIDQLPSFGEDELSDEEVSEEEVIESDIPETPTYAMPSQADLLYR